MLHNIGDITTAIHYCKTEYEVDKIYDNIIELQSVEEIYTPIEMNIISTMYWVKVKLLES